MSDEGKSRYLGMMADDDPFYTQNAGWKLIMQHHLAPRRAPAREDEAPPEQIESDHE
jgi:hypothetical protein